MNLLITRHGETYDNIHHILTGQKDVELTEKGKKDAVALSEKLQKYTIDIIYCSTLMRARETIRPFLESNNVPIVYTDNMKEMDLGRLNGASIEEGKSEKGKGLDHKVGGGESLRDIYHRAQNVIDMLKEKYPGSCVLLVGHNAINRNIIGIIRGWSIEEINEKKERYPHAEILEFTV